MRHRDHIFNVLMPDLQGRFLFTVLRGAGYGFAVMARTLAGFQKTALELMFEEGVTTPEVAPAWINVCAWSPSMVQCLERAHANAIEDDRRMHVSSRLSAYQQAFDDKVPPGFAPVPKRHRGPLFYGSKSTDYVWTGTDEAYTKLVAACAPIQWYEPEGAVPIAEPFDKFRGHVDPRLVFPGRRDSTVVNVVPFANAFAHTLMRDTPCFLARWGMEVPTALDEPLGRWRRAQEARKAADAQKQEFRRVEFEQEDAAERAKLLALFGAPLP